MIEPSTKHLAALKKITGGLESVEENLEHLQRVLEDSQSRRSRHLVFIMALLYLALAVNVAGLYRLVFNSAARNEIWYFIAAAVTQIVFLVLVIVGMVLHGMSVGRSVGLSVGMLRSYADELYNEFSEVISRLFSSSKNIETIREELEQFMARQGPESNLQAAGEQWREVAAANVEFSSLAAEIRAARVAVEQKTPAKDLAVSAYGFAAIPVLLSTTGLAVADTSQAARIVLSGISALCAVAAYVIVRKPTATQYYMEEVLRKLGFSARSVALRVKSGHDAVPVEHQTEALLEPESDQNQH